MRLNPYTQLQVFLLSACCLVGCGTLSGGRGWGQDATLTPGWDRIGRAALDAASSPVTWGPAAGALAVQVGNADHKVTRWAMKRTPLYGSKINAVHASDSLGSAISAAYVVTALATPSGNAPGDWALAKAKGFGVGYGAVAITSQVTGFLKDETARTRPDGTDTQSFPSNHAMKAGVYGVLASKNLGSLPVSGGTRTASRLVLGTLTAGVAWARIEAGRHYPSDVLAGVAMGHFIGAFINDAFLGVDASQQAVVFVEPFRRGGLIGLSIPYD